MISKLATITALGAPIVLACVMLTGCAATAPQATVSMVEPPRAHSIQRQPPAPQPKADTAAIDIDEEIVRLCNLPTGHFTAHFGFDSASITGAAANALDAVARCMTDGALQGRELNIVGHADPRGPLDYNLGLGQQRAGRVGEYLVLHGIATERVATSSLGEIEASGTDEPGWARDRKVEILLAEGG